jgi:hypothetical protein
VVTLLAIGVSACSSDAPDAKVANDTTFTALSLCELPVKGEGYIDRAISVRGKAFQSNHFAGLMDDRCPDAMVFLNSVGDGPYVLGCLLEGQTAGCAGLSPDKRMVTVVGVLRHTTNEPSHDGAPPVLNATVDITRFEGATAE